MRTHKTSPCSQSIRPRETKGPSEQELNITSQKSFAFLGAEATFGRPGAAMPGCDVRRQWLVVGEAPRAALPNLGWSLLC